jgi:hypothetical protein
MTSSMLYKFHKLSNHQIFNYFPSGAIQTVTLLSFISQVQTISVPFSKPINSIKVMGMVVFKLRPVVFALFIFVLNIIFITSYISLVTYNFTPYVMTFVVFKIIYGVTYFVTPNVVTFIY